MCHLANLEGRYTRTFRRQSRFLYLTNAGKWSRGLVHHSKSVFKSKFCTRGKEDEEKRLCFIEVHTCNLHCRPVWCLNYILLLKFDGFWYLRKSAFVDNSLKIRATRWVCEKNVQNVAPAIFVEIHTLRLAWNMKTLLSSWNVDVGFHGFCGILDLPVGYIPRWWALGFIKVLILSIIIRCWFLGIR
jgi:hypothetical protein